MREGFEFLKGDTLEEQMKSADNILKALNRKGVGKVNVKNLSNSPIMVELKQVDVVYPALLVGIKGVIGNIIIYSGSVSGNKEATIQFNIENETGGEIGRVKIKGGFTPIPKTFEIKENAIVFISYSLPEGVTISSPPIVGFTFLEALDNKGVIDVITPIA